MCSCVCVCPRFDSTRLSKSFAAAQTGMRYLMCQLMFNRLFVAKDGASIDYVASQYDKHWSLLPWVSTPHTAVVPNTTRQLPCMYLLKSPKYVPSTSASTPNFKYLCTNVPITYVQCSPSMVRVPQFLCCVPPVLVGVP